jgi:RNA polymerase sigma-70 factor (ECF subfamily)
MSRGAAPHAPPTRDAADPSDSELVASVLRGEASRFGVLVRRHNQRLYRAARAILGDDAEAEDVVQDAYVRAYHALASFRGEAAFSTWITRIAVNEAIARRRARARLADVTAEEVPMATDRTPERDVADAELVRLIEREIDALPDGLREVLVLRDVEELGTSDAAEILGVTEEALRVRLHRARRALATAVGERLEVAAPQAYRIMGARCDRLSARVGAALGIALDDD